MKYWHHFIKVKVISVHPSPTQAKSEAKEAEEEAKKLKLDDSEASLFAAIAQRQASRAKQSDDFLSQLEAKYSNTGAAKKGKKSKKWYHPPMLYFCYLFCCFFAINVEI